MERKINYTEIIESMMKINNGYITSKDVDDFNIHRMYLNAMWKEGKIDRIARGIYYDSNKIEDVYYSFSLNMPKAIFSHMTALYFHNLSIKAPDSAFDITVKKTYNNQHLKDHNVFYVSENVFELGLTEVNTNMGNIVKAYDIERCICDIIRSKKRMDIQHIKYSINAYLKSSHKNLVKLSYYAEKMNMKKEVMNYLEFFYD